MSYSILTSQKEVREQIEPVIVQVWTGLGYQEDTIEWPNTYFLKPGNGPWIRVAYPQMTTTPMTWAGIGGVCQNETIMLLAIQVFTPRNAGDLVLIQAMDGFRAAFERKTYGSGIRFSGAEGPSQTALEPQWSGMVVTFPFQFIEEIQQ